MPKARFLFAILVSSAVVLPAWAGGDISMAERVEAQRAIERVAWEHRLGDRPAFDTAVPPEVLAAKVRRYLRESAALEKVWGDRVTGYRLGRELERMARGSRLQGRLREIFEALHDDPVLLQECLARPAFVAREVRTRYAWDPALHAAERARAEAAARARGRVVERPDAFVVEFDPAAGRSRDLTVAKVPFETWWAANVARFDPGAVRSAADLSIALPRLAATVDPDPCAADDTWDGGMGSQGPPARRTEHAAVWTGSEMIVWGGVSDTHADIAYNDGARYDPATDTWSPMTTPSLSPRNGVAAVWTGTRMIVWGGGIRASNWWNFFSDGASYDPVSDTWTPISITGAPSNRVYAATVWTGSSMLVFGGEVFDTTVHTLKPVRDGARYDPASDTWSPMAAAPLTKGPYESAAWVGGRIWLWDQGEGAGYDPVSNAWTPMSTNAALSTRKYSLVVGTDHKVAVWAGYTTALLNDGALYDPASDQWRAMSTVGAPPGRENPLAVWTGTVLFFWGGTDTGSNPIWSGGRYDPATDSWAPAETRDAPEAVKGFTMVWTGSEAILWGGYPEFDGAKRYDPVTNRWSPIGRGAPHSYPGVGSVWTGSELIIPYTGNGEGERYDPVSDTWTPITGIPSTSLGPSVWTGSLVVMWGGTYSLRHAGRYDPVADSWSPVSQVGEPSLRTGHTLVWTGTRMIVWGGYHSPTVLNDGGSYDPVTDTWTTISTTGTPLPRQGATAVWTGSRMIVWGGKDSASAPLGDGGVYDPAADTWAPMAVASSPSPRYAHTAVWTGSEMIVWGGFDGSSGVATGARYDPSSNTWQPTSTVGAPAARSSHTAVWTGHVMLVWGGKAATPMNSGGRYDPATDGWAPMTTVGAPAARSGHAMAWTGSLALVWGGGPPAGGRYALGHAVDDDGDGFSECQGDCKDADATVWSRPDEVSGLTVGSDKMTITWDVAPSGSVASPVYTLFRSPRPDVFASASCVAVRVTATSASDPEIPAPGGAFYYLVGAANGCTASTDDGTRSDGTSRFATCAP